MHAVRMKRSARQRAGNIELACSKETEEGLSASSTAAVLPQPALVSL